MPSNWITHGHERVVEALAQSIKDGKPSHAYLFNGPQCVGKMTLAIDLACALNCTSAEKPCGTCAQCKRTRDGKHSDVQIIAVGSGESDGEAHKEISIKQIEALQESASLAPFEGTFKIFIINRAESLNINAANRLLKTLEEPAGRVCIILLSREPARLLPTVVSRCRVYDLRAVRPKTIEWVLVKFHDIDAEKARDLARLAEGRVGWAIQAAQNPAVEETRKDDVDKIIDLLEAGYVERLIIAGRLAQDFARKRDEINEWLVLLRQFWRDVLLLKGEQADSIINTDRREVLDRMIGALTLVEIAAAVRDVVSTITRLHLNANPRLTLETFVLNLPLVPAAPTPVPTPASRDQEENE